MEKQLRLLQYLKNWKKNMDFKYNLEFTDDCKNEILEIYEYISQNLASTEAAKKLMKKIKTSIMHLSEEPYLYMRIDTTNNSHNNFRRIVVNNYVILYLVSEANHTVYISHMYYGKKNICSLNLLFIHYY